MEPSILLEAETYDKHRIKNLKTETLETHTRHKAESV